jgi:hypothetical protein
MVAGNARAVGLVAFVPVLTGPPSYVIDDELQGNGNGGGKDEGMVEIAQVNDLLGAD